MKVLILGDTHFGARNDNPIVLDHFMRFYENVFFPVIETHKPDIVLQLGDLLDRRKFANFATLDRVRRDFISPIVDYYKTPLWVLVGNHDTYYRNTLAVNGIAQSFGDFILNGKLRLFDRTEETEIGLIVPWICNDNSESTFELVKQSSSDYCYGHFELQGFDMYRGVPCEHGDDPNFLSRFKGVYSGHFHTRSKKKNITYVGTPYDIIWSDIADEKCFVLLDTDTGKEEWFVNGEKLHHKIVFDSSKYTRATVKNLNVDGYAQKFVKLIVTDSSNPEVVEQLAKGIRSVNPASFSIVDSSFSPELSNDTIQTISHKDPLTALIDEITSKYSNPNKVLRMKKLANEIYESALAGGLE